MVKYLFSEELSEIFEVKRNFLQLNINDSYLPSQDKNPVKASTVKYKITIVDKGGAKEIIAV